jgi:hypothetical protein
MAFGFAFLWLAFAFGIRLYDMRKPQIYVSTLTGGQRHHRATLAWIEGTLPWATPHSHGRLVVVDTRIDGKIERYASRSLPEDWVDCRLWLEEAPDTVQALASCQGREPVRLTAAGLSLPGLGPDNKPGTLYDLYPLTSVEPEKIVNKIHRHDAAPAHPLLFVLGALAMAPLAMAAARTLRKARRIGRQPVIEGVMEQADKGALIIRSGDRRVTVFVEQGEMLSVGFGRLAPSGAMAVEGLHAAVQGEVEHQVDGAFRGGETMRLRKGAILVVGDLLTEARQRLFQAATLDMALAGAGVVLAAIVSMGLGW